jgi:hypothetical protein
VAESESASMKRSPAVDETFTSMVMPALLDRYSEHEA